jgi:spore coat polysaccharide biosynthesis protein SpsF
MAWCETQNVSCFRGSENDVLARYYECARSYMLDPVVRLTADNPFTDITELNRLIAQHRQQNNHFTDSLSELPVGVGAEVFSFGALERSHREGREPHHREHVDEYILENPSMFRTGILSVPEAKRRPDIRLTVDTPEDLRLARFVVEQAKGQWVGTEEAIALCSRFA